MNQHQCFPWIFFFSFLTFPLFAQHNEELKSGEGLYWKKTTTIYDSTNHAVKIGVKKAGSSTSYALMAEKPLWPQLNEFTSLSQNQSTCQDRTWACWAYAGGNLIGKDVPSISIEALTYHSMRLRLEEIYQNQSLPHYKDVEGSDVFRIYEIIDKVGIWPSSVFTSHVRKDFGNSRPMNKRMFDFLVPDYKDDKNISRETIDRCLFLLDSMYGVPPQEFTFLGKTYTPKTFAKKYNVRSQNYTGVVSRMRYPYGTYIENDPELKPDFQVKGWNVPVHWLQELMIFAVKEGNGFVYGGDASEPYIMKAHNVTYVPDWVVPWKTMSDHEKALRREIGFYYGETRPNHAYHVFDVVTKDGKNWFLERDSGVGAWTTNSDMKGYWIHDGVHLALKMYSIDMEIAIFKRFLQKKAKTGGDDDVLMATTILNAL